MNAIQHPSSVACIALLTQQAPANSKNQWIVPSRTDPVTLALKLCLSIIEKMFSDPRAMELMNILGIQKPAV